MIRVVNLKNDDKRPACQICVYSENVGGLSCTKNGRHVKDDFSCKKFALDILSKNNRRKRTVMTHNPEEFRIN